jgi:DNA-binding NarL/FixJ family response regulator
VLVISADPLARAGLAAILGDAPGVHIAGQIDPQGSQIESIPVFDPDVIVWSTGWNPSTTDDSDGEAELDLMREIAGTGDDLPVLALLTETEAAAGLWGSGVRGLLPRDASPAQLVAALGAVAGGLIVIDPLLAGQITPALPITELELTEPLTPREDEVLRLMAEGLSNRAIALELDISEHTVKFHVNAILNKLNAQSRTDAVVRAMRIGLIPL